MLKRATHNPAHLFLDNTNYFITGAIYLKRPLLADSALKHQLVDFIRKYFKKCDWQLHYWVIMNNHYHLIGKSQKGKDLSAIIRNIHRFSAVPILKATNCKKPIWWNYWDYCPRDEADYITRANYLLFNPIKHGYVRNLHDYPFSSFHEIYNHIGRDKLAKQFQEYPDYKHLTLSENDDDY